MVFHLLFPCSANVNHLREEFLVKLAQLAICIGLTPILDLVAIRLKVFPIFLYQQLSLGPGLLGFSVVSQLFRGICY